MGCSASKLEDEEAVQLCKDRRNFIRQAVEQRTRFATAHLAYIQSLRRVSLALRSYIDGDDQYNHRHHHNDFMSSDSYSTSPFTPVKQRFSQDDIFRIPLKLSPSPSPSPSPKKPIQYRRGTYHHQSIHYLRSGGGNSSVSVQQRPPQSPQTMRINSYYNNPMESYSGGADGFFGMQQSSSSSPMNPSYFAASSPCRPTYPPPSPQTSQWDFFWNPFASLESYGYPSHNSGIGHLTSEDEMAGLRQVREEEGIPDLEEDVEEEKQSPQQSHEIDEDIDGDDDDSDDVEGEEEVEMVGVPAKPQNVDQPTAVNAGSNHARQAEATTSHPCEAEVTTRSANDTQHRAREFQCHGSNTAQKMDVRLEVSDPVGNSQVAEPTTPGFTVYIDSRPSNISEVMRDIESQFFRICDSAKEVSIMLEASRAQFCSPSNELTAMKLLNPVALFRTASSRSTSSRFLLQGPSSCRDDDYCETSSEFSEDSSCMLSGSHQTTLDRLYAWEKKLFEEVKNGERIRIAYEKRCLQLRNCDALAGEDPSSVDKVKRAIRDLYTQIQVSMHSIESISRRIEKLRDEELHPQLMELIQGLTRMWKTMADSHLIQKRIIDAAKTLLASPKLRDNPPPPASRLARSATNLESELRNWRVCFEIWISSQRSYARALAGWLVRCAPPPPSAPGHARSPLSPPRSFSFGSSAPPIFEVCVQWSRALDAVSDEQALEGLDFFAAGVASVVAQQREEETAARRAAVAGEVEGEEAVTAAVEKMAELAVRVVCAGMAVAVGSLAKFAVSSVEGCEDFVRGHEGEKAGKTGI